MIDRKTLTCIFPMVSLHRSFLSSSFRFFPHLLLFSCLAFFSRLLSYRVFAIFPFSFSFPFPSFPFLLFCFRESG